MAEQFTGTRLELSAAAAQERVVEDLRNDVGRPIPARRLRRWGRSGRGRGRARRRRCGGLRGGCRVSNWQAEEKTKNLNLTIAIIQDNQVDEKAAISGPLELKFLPKGSDESSPPENFMNERQTKRNIAEKVSQGGTIMHPFHPSHLNKGLMEASRGQLQSYQVSTISLCSSSLRKVLNGYLELPFLAKWRWRWRSATAWTRSGLRRSTARQKTWMDAQHQQMGRTRLNYFPKGATKSTHGCSAIEMKTLILFSKMCNKIKS